MVLFYIKPAYFTHAHSVRIVSTSRARIDGWGGVGDENLFHLVTQGHNVGGDRVGKRGVTKGCTYLPTVGW